MAFQLVSGGVYMCGVYMCGVCVCVYVPHRHVLFSGLERLAPWKSFEAHFSN